MSRGGFIDITLEINLSKIRENVLQIRQEVGVKIMLMLKANAYGHGDIAVARHVEGDVDAFGVETLEEGVALRKNGISKDILVLACQSDEIEQAYQNSLTIGVHNNEIANKILSLAKERKISLDCLKTHIKVDSGMHRLGLCKSELEKVVKAFQSCGVQVEGVYSHLRDGTICQKAKFDELAKIVHDCYPNAIRHLASSHSLCKKELRYDMVRAGICAYQGAMRAKSTVIEVRTVEKGECVGYGSKPLEKTTNVATVFGGYADGILRENPPCAYVGGEKCKPIGNACMDVFFVDTGQYKAKVGQEAVLFEPWDIGDIAKAQNTIDYVVMTALKGRVKRCYDA